MIKKSEIFVRSSKKKKKKKKKRKRDNLITNLRGKVTTKQTY